MYVTVQEATPVDTSVKLQVEELKLPRPFVEKPTVPVGVVAIPELVSLTTTSHEVASFTAIDDGEQLTEVNVERFVAVNAKADAELVE